MKYSFNDLIDIMKKLRSPAGCPWDKEQNIRSLLPYLIEESCEYIDAAQADDKNHMCEELGDVLFQVIFHSQIAKENGDFSIEDVVHGVSEKMIRRHPHVFGELHVENSAAVVREWERIKATEKNNREQAKNSAMDKVSKSLPTLAKAQELQRRAAKVGFDWKKNESSFEKVREEFNEFLEEKQKAIAEKAEKFNELEMVRLEDEFGDILFSLVNAGRHLGLNAETALMRANSKFENRFRQIEKLSDTALNEKSDTELLVLWEKAKHS